MAGGYGYDDEDHGDVILYRGTDSKDSTPTDVTMRLIESCDMVRNPVRVIRSSNLKDSPYKPIVGYRYDGLYDVVSYTVTDPTKAIHRFKLVRRPDQDPIRSSGPEIRPTQYEVAEYTQLRLNGRAFL